MGGNLPPGCDVSDIPGNRPKDIKWQKFIEDSGEGWALYEEYYGEEPETYTQVYEAMDEDEEFKDMVNERFKEGLRDRPHPPEDKIPSGSGFREKHEFRRPPPEREEEEED